MAAKVKLKRWDSAEHLKTEADIACYGRACLEEGRDDPTFIATALGNIARARGMSRLARETGLTREGLYKALSPGGNPEFGAPTPGASGVRTGAAAAGSLRGGHGDP